MGPRPLAPTILGQSITVSTRNSKVLNTPLEKSKQKVPPPSPLSTQKSLLPPKDEKNLPLEELFAYIFGIYIKFGYKNPSILTPYDSIDVAT